MIICAITTTVPFRLCMLVLGAGLLGRYTWAIKWSELVLVLNGLFALVVFIVLTFVNVAVRSTAFDPEPGLVGRVFMTLLAGAVALFCFWAYKTLVRDDVRALAQHRSAGQVA